MSTVFSQPAVLATVCLVVALTHSINAQAAKFNRVLDIGDRAPAWRDLPGVDGKRHSLQEYRRAKLVVVVFFCNHCPVAKAYEDRLLKLAVDTKREDVRFVLISVSHYEADSLEAMKRRATARRYPFPYLQDPSQKIARDYGAYVTPQVFVLNRAREIAYMGAIDDSMDDEHVTEHYLRQAITALLKGQAPEVEETRPVGCHIDFQ